MLTYEASVTFAPHSTVTGLVLSPDGETIAWSESNGSVNIYQDMKKVNEIKCEGVVTGLTFHQDHLMVSDDAFGIKRYDFSGNKLWGCEVPGGVSMFKIANNFIAIVDNLGRLLTADFNGELINSNLPYSSIIELETYAQGIIIVQEDGRVYCFNGNQNIWIRPKRGDVGESITALGISHDGNLIIGREGYALVPGEEEALELEIWDISRNRLITRLNLNNRLLQVNSDENKSVIGLDDGSVFLIDGQINDDFKLKEPTMECKFPIKTLLLCNNSIVAGSWFYIHGLNPDGKTWIVEHQGIVQYSVYSKNTNCFYFAGDDQNDFTDTEPIGCINFGNQPITVDKSELTLWFEQKEVVAQLSADEIYSDDDKMTELLNNDSISNNQEMILKDEQFTNLLSALGDDVEANNYSEEVSVDKESDGESLLDELLDDVITNKPLVANAGSDMTYQSEDDGSAVIILDGSATKNQQGKVITWSWIDDTGREISTLSKFRAKLSIGIYRFELRVSDLEGNSTADSVQIEVV